MADPSGKICLGFNMGNPDHEQVKKILDSLPKWAKSNFIVAAVLEYWVRHDNVIDVRDYRKQGSCGKKAIAISDNNDKQQKKLSTPPLTATCQASPVAATIEVFVSNPVPTGGGNEQSGEDEKLQKILMQGLNSFK